jgi:hypothetical protein
MSSFDGQRWRPGRWHTALSALNEPEECADACLLPAQEKDKVLLLSLIYRKRGTQHVKLEFLSQCF